MPYTTTSGIDFVVEILRQRVADTKTIYTDVSKEDGGVASGVDYEIFETDNMPILSGADTYFRVGRWSYTQVDNEAAAVGIRGYVFDVASGTFLIPSNAILAESGERAKLSYTWVDEQETRFRDEDLKFYIGDAVNTVNSVFYDFGHTFVSDSITGMDISPTVTASEVAPFIYARYAAILIREEIETESIGDRIYVRDLNITIDTSKGLGDLSRSLKDLRLEFRNIINTLVMEGQEAAMQVIDVYSTKPIDGTYEYQASYYENEEMF